MNEDTPQNLAGDLAATRTRAAQAAGTTGPFLVVIEDEESWRFRIPPMGTLTIGRIPGCEVQLKDPTASRKHAQLRVDQGRIFISDLGSYNGTAVNGETVKGERELHAGDLIQICATTISVHVPERRGGSVRPVVVDDSVFHPRLAVELERSRRFARVLSIFAIRLEGNDRSSATRLAAALRTIDTVAFDGDAGLLVLAPELGIEELEGVGKRMSALVPGSQIGAATFPDDGVDAATLLASARAAAQQAPRNQMQTASSVARRLNLGTVEIVVADPAMMRTFALIERIAVSELPVLVQGETGSGKESAAAAVHHYSRRRGGPLVTINCAAIPDNLVESELFGHEKGAFTGALAARTGLFEAANGGTIFLDEIGELPLSVQAKLLRALDSRRITRIGSTTERPIDVRIVAATNRDLRTEVAANRFREDLYFRLGGATIALPPLRDRPRDLPLLAREMLGNCVTKMRRDPLAISSAAMQAIAAYRWPGNVRELRNAMELAAAQADGDVVEVWHLPPAVIGEPDDRGPASSGALPVVGAAPAADPVAVELERRRSADSTLDPFQDSIMPIASGTPPTSVPPSRMMRRPAESFRPIAEELRALERKRMIQALVTADGVQTKAAQLLRMPRRTFVAKMKEYAIHEELERDK